MKQAKPIFGMVDATTEITGKPSAPGQPSKPPLHGYPLMDKCAAAVAGTSRAWSAPPPLRRGLAGRFGAHRDHVTYDIGYSVRFLPQRLLGQTVWIGAGMAAMADVMATQQLPPWILQSDKAKAARIAMPGSRTSQAISGPHRTQPGVYRVKPEAVASRLRPSAGMRRQMDEVQLRKKHAEMASAAMAASIIPDGGHRLAIKPARIPGEFQEPGPLNAIRISAKIPW